MFAALTLPKHRHRYCDPRLCLLYLGSSPRQKKKDVWETITLSRAEQIDKGPIRRESPEFGVEQSLPWIETEDLPVPLLPVPYKVI